MYDGQKTRYEFGFLDAGAGGEVFAVLGPKGKKGTLVDYGSQHVTEAFTATTLASFVSVGTVADADAYGDEISMATQAIDSGGRATNNIQRKGTAAYEAQFINKRLPADTPVALHVTAPTGGTPAGMAHFWMEIIWDL
jgi:hypothetical protein